MLNQFNLKHERAMLADLLPSLNCTDSVWRIRMHLLLTVLCSANHDINQVYLLKSLIHHSICVITLTTITFNSLRLNNSWFYTFILFSFCKIIIFKTLFMFILNKLSIWYFYVISKCCWSYKLALRSRNNETQIIIIHKCLIISLISPR